MEAMQLLYGAVGLAVAWLGLLERKFHVMKQDFDQRLNDKNRIHEIVQENLRRDIARLEAKIDVLIGELMQRNHG